MLYTIYSLVYANYNENLLRIFSSPFQFPETRVYYAASWPVINHGWDSRVPGMLHPGFCFIRFSGKVPNT